MPSQIWLVRHAESAGNVADAGAHAAGAEQLDLAWRDPDTPLSPAGLRQAASLGEWMRRQAAQPDLVVSSPYVRARDTAAGLGLPVRVDERLRERDLGSFDGFTRAGIRARYPDEAARLQRLGKVYFRPPGGESWCDVALRVRSLLRDLDTWCPDGTVLCATHQAVIMCFRWVLEALDEQEVLDVDRTSRVGNASVSRWERAGHGWRRTAFDDRSPTAPAHVPETAEPALDTHVD